jgi:hypothetical protein
MQMAMKSRCSYFNLSVNSNLHSFILPILFRFRNPDDVVIGLILEAAMSAFRSAPSCGTEPPAFSPLSEASSVVLLSKVGFGVPIYISWLGTVG